MRRAGPSSRIWSYRHHRGARAGSRRRRHTEEGRKEMLTKLETECRKDDARAMVVVQTQIRALESESHENRCRTATIRTARSTPGRSDAPSGPVSFTRAPLLSALLEAEVALAGPP